MESRVHFKFSLKQQHNIYRREHEVKRFRRESQRNLSGLLFSAVKNRAKISNALWRVLKMKNPGKTGARL